MKNFLAALKSYLKALDWALLAICVFASCFGLAMIQSATKSLSGDRYVLVQSAMIILGVVMYFVISMFDISHLAVFWKILFVLGILLILSGLVFGRSANGNRSWIYIKLGSFSIGLQPSELVKLIFIITISKHIELAGADLNRVRNLLLLCAHFAVYAGVLLLVTKDDGMVMMYTLIFFAIMFAAGVKLRYFVIGGAALAGAIPLIWNYVFSEYQRMRFLVVFDPTLDIQGKGYQAYVSKIAIRGGGIFGQGYGQGSTTQFGHLPEKQTDFIFSVICEELGLIGGIAVILVISLVAAKCIANAIRVRHDKFSYLVCVGVASMLIFQLILNVGMCLGVVPVIGLTLPFFSYGGTSVLTMFLSVGVVCSLRMHITPKPYMSEASRM